MDYQQGQKPVVTQTSPSTTASTPTTVTNANGGSAPTYTSTPTYAAAPSVYATPYPVYTTPPALASFAAATYVPVPVPATTTTTVVPVYTNTSSTYYHDPASQTSQVTSTSTPASSTADPGARNSFPCSGCYSVDCRAAEAAFHTNEKSTSAAFGKSGQWYQFQSNGSATRVVNRS